MYSVNFMSVKDLKQQEAYKVYCNANGVSASRMFMRLALHAKQALDNSKTAEKNSLRDLHKSNLAAELKKNAEAHAAIDCIRFLLEYNKKKITDRAISNPFGHQVVDLYESIASKDGTVLMSPMGRAKQIRDHHYPELGDYLMRCLNRHAKDIAYRENFLGHDLHKAPQKQPQMSAQQAYLRM